MSYLEIEPARAKRKNAEKLWNDSEWKVEEKFNGWRFLMHVGGDLDRVYLTGRRVSLQTGLLSEKGELVPMLHPTLSGVGYTVLDGEIMPPFGACLRDIAGIMNSSPEESARNVARLGPPTYKVFDLLFVDGTDIREHSALERRLELVQLMGAIRHPLISLVEQFPSRLEIYEQIVERGGEGVVLKDDSAPYGEGWVKVKRYSTLDVVVTGFTDAKFGRTGQYHGQIGAAVIGVYTSSGELVEVGRVSGMDDTTRLDMTHNKEKWIGSVIEVRAQEFGKDRLMHPRFCRSRPDANPRDATFEKMMSDLAAESREEPRQRSLF